MTPPMPEPMVVHMMSVHQGQDDKNEVHILGENNAVVLENLIVRRQGSRERRRGVQTFGGRTDVPNGLFAMNDTVLSQETLFGVYGGQLYAEQAGGAFFNRASGISLTSTLHQGVAGRYNANTATYIVQGVVNDSNVSLASRLVAVTELNTYTQASSAPIGACWFQNRLWTGPQVYVANDTDTIWWSALGDGLSYSSLNTLRIEPGVGGRVQSLFPLRGFSPSIVVFKQRAVCTVEPHWGTNSSLIPAAGDALDTIKTNIRLISPSVGCAAPMSVQFVPGAPGGDIYFLAQDGIRALTRANDDTVSGISQAISDPIVSTIERINFAYAHKCVSAVLDNKYHLAVPLDGATENTHVLVFDFQTGAWSVLTWTPKTLFAARLAETRDKLFMQYNTITADCSNTATYSAYHSYRCYAGIFDPNGVPVPFHEDSRGLVFSGIDKRKRWDWASISFRNDAQETCSIGLAYNVDKRGWVTSGSGVAGAIAGGLDTVLAETPLPWGVLLGATRTFKFNLTDVDPGYFIQLRYFGNSDFSKPVILDLAIAARPITAEFDNSIT